MFIDWSDSPAPTARFFHHTKIKVVISILNKVTISLNRSERPWKKKLTKIFFAIASPFSHQTKAKWRACLTVVYANGVRVYIKLSARGCISVSLCVQCEWYLISLAFRDFLFNWVPLIPAFFLWIIPNYTNKIFLSLSQNSTFSCCNISIRCHITVLYL